MRPASRRDRARRTFAAAVSVLIATAWVTSGCGTIGNGQQLSGRAQLVDDLSSRMTGAGSLTYTAAYSLPGGASATIAQAQNPLRVAYTYPGGKLVLNPDRTADCRTQGGATTCTVSAPPSPPDNPPTALLSQVGGRGLIAPALVISLLGAVAANPDTDVTQHDTTLSGEHATCLDVRGLTNARASSFTACVTTEGVLASFSGTVGSDPIDIALDQYRTTVVSDAFALPGGAKIVDGRPR